MSEHYDFHYQPTGSGAISGQQVLQQTEDAINELGDYVNDNVGGAMDVAQQALETAQTAETNAQTALDTANSFSSAIQSAQQDASTALSTAQTAQTTASNANNTAIQAQQDASNAVTTANNASGQVSTLSGTVTALGQRVTTAEGNIGQNTSDITALTTRVGTAEGNITTLQNDVTIAQGNASSAMATAGQVKQQAFVFRYSSTALTASSTNSNALLDNTDNLKVGDKVIDSSGVLFSITAIDTQNSTFTIGTALIDLANDSDVMHLSGAETAAGLKTFSEYITSDGSTTGDEYSGNSKTNLWLMANRDDEDVSGVLIDTFRQNTAQGTATHIIGFGIKENSVRFEGCRFSWIWDNNLNGYSFSIRPTLQGTNQAVEHNLGSSTDKWDKINGLNPSSLGMPDLDNGIDISSYFDATQISTNTYTAPADGYISLAVSSPNRGSINAVIGSDFWCNTAYGAVNPNDSNSFLQCIFVPILKNQTITVYLRTTGGTIESAKFFPCLGNV